MSNKTKKQVDFEGTMELSKVIAYLESILTGLKAKTINLQRGIESVTLEPENTMSVEVTAKRRSTKESLVIKLRWKKEPSLLVKESPVLEVRTRDPLAQSSVES